MIDTNSGAIWLFYNKKGNSVAKIQNGEVVRQGGKFRLIFAFESDEVIRNKTLSVAFKKPGDVSPSLFYVVGTGTSQALLTSKAQFRKIKQNEISYGLMDGNQYTAFEFNVPAAYGITEKYGMLTVLTKVTKVNGSIDRLDLYTYTLVNRAAITDGDYIKYNGYYTELISSGTNQNRCDSTGTLDANGGYIKIGNDVVKINITTSGEDIQNTYIRYMEPDGNPDNEESNDEIYFQGSVQLYIEPTYGKSTSNTNISVSQYEVLSQQVSGLGDGKLNKVGDSATNLSIDNTGTGSAATINVKDPTSDNNVANKHYVDINLAPITSIKRNGTTLQIAADKSVNVSVPISAITRNGETLTITNESVDIEVPIIQYSSMPVASSSNEGNVVQFIGTTTSDYTNGYFYKNIHFDVQESITVTGNDTPDMMSISEMNEVGLTALKSKLNPGTYIFHKHSYPTKITSGNSLTLVRYTNGDVGPSNDDNDNNGTTPPIIPVNGNNNIEYKYAWMEVDSTIDELYCTKTLAIDKDTKLYEYNQQTGEVGNEVTGSIKVEERDSDPSNGSYWTLQTANDFKAVELSDYGIYSSVEGSPGNEITVAYTAAKNGYYWTRINVQPIQSRTKTYNSIQEMVVALNSMPATEMEAGDDIYLVAPNVPDLWIGKVESSSSTYTYTTDEAFVNALTDDLTTTIQVGYYRLLKHETKIDLSDYVQKTRTIAGINLSADITKEALQSALDFANKMDKANPTGTGSISMNRLANSTVGNKSATFGDNCEASGENSFASGNYTTASGANSTTSGLGNIASGQYSSANGYRTRAGKSGQFVFGELNIIDSENNPLNRWDTYSGRYVEIVGNGTQNGELCTYSNARTLDWNGNEVLAGTSQATGFKTANGTSSQFLKADGSVDSNTYVTTASVAAKTGSSAPGQTTSADFIGQFYINTAQYNVYICIRIDGNHYTWLQLARESEPITVTVLE